MVFNNKNLISQKIFYAEKIQKSEAYFFEIPQNLAAKREGFMETEKLCA